jgi:hypothetical protein
MARTYLSTLSPRRRWAIAGAAAGLTLALTVGLGEPWGFSTIAGLPADPGARSVPLLARTVRVFHWTTSSGGLGGSGPWTAALVLDLVWPLLILIGTRALAGGLALKRARLSLCVGVWSVATLTGAFAGLIAGLLDHADRHGGMRIAFAEVTARTATGDVLTLQAATLALVGVLLGWLPGVAAAVAYSVGRGAPRAEPGAAGKTGGRKAQASPGGPDAGTPSAGTLSGESSNAGTPSGDGLDGLEGFDGFGEPRRPREGAGLPDVRTSEFFRI